MSSATLGDHHVEVVVKLFLKYFGFLSIVAEILVSDGMQGCWYVDTMRLFYKLFSVVCR